ncbi:MAG: ERF family protein [Dehalococcoidia bacterium]|jgi:hypothetical protein
MESKIAAALVAVQAQAGKVGMSGKNEHHRYDYAKLEDYIDALERVLINNKLAVVTSVTAATQLEPRMTKREGTEYVVDVELMLTVIHESGESYQISAHGQGQDSADKAIYKAITGARKYGLAMLFNLATTDYPENDSNVNRGKDNKPVAKTQPSTAQKSSTTPQSAASDDRTEYWLKIVEFCHGDEDAARDWLEKESIYIPKDGSAERPGKRNIREIKSERQWDYIKRQIDRAYGIFPKLAAPQSAAAGAMDGERDLPF